VLVCLFVCHSNISGTAERICAKFTVTTCFGPRSDEFECQGQRSKVKVTGDKKNEKVRHFVRESSSGAQCSCGICFSSGPWGAVLGGLACGVCLVKHL